MDVVSEKVGIEDSEKGRFYLSDDLTKFVSQLEKSDDEFETATFAFISNKFDESLFAKRLKDLGATKSRTPGNPHFPRPTWHWKKYVGRLKDEPAWLEVEKNNIFGYAPKFSNLPDGSPVLRVTVALKNRTPCIRELETNLHDIVELLDVGGKP